jgi:hypothetical protein
MPFTDSGYASAPNLILPLASPGKPHGRRHLIPLDRSNLEAENGTGTLYSEAASTNPGRAQSYISDLCSDIRSKLGHSSDAIGQEGFSRTLSELIRTFAVKIGIESSAQLNRDIMYFIHKRHQ